MSTSRIPSPARSEGAKPRRHKPRRSGSTSSTAKLDKPSRLTAIISDSFVISPLPSRRSVLNDDTEIEEPRRRSWWKKLDDLTESSNVMAALETKTNPGTNNVEEEYNMDVEIISQETKQFTLDLPESSDGESISSIVIPQRKLFTQKDGPLQKQYDLLINNRESLPKLQKSNIDHDKELVDVGPKNLFNKKPRSKPIFPTSLLNITANKTFDKTKEPPIVVPQVRSLFGNRPANKRKNMFADFLVSESEDEIPEIQGNVFGFMKKNEQKRRGSSFSTKQHSPASSIIDIDIDDWKLLPSSTMVGSQLEDGASTPSKRPRLSKLLEIKESENTVETNNTSKNKSNISQSFKNKSKGLLIPEANIVENEVLNTSTKECNTANQTRSINKSQTDKSISSRKIASTRDNVEIKSVENHSEEKLHSDNILKICEKITKDQRHVSNNPKEVEAINDDEDFTLEYDSYEEIVDIHVENGNNSAVKSNKTLLGNELLLNKEVSLQKPNASQQNMTTFKSDEIIPRNEINVLNNKSINKTININNEVYEGKTNTTGIYIEQQTELKEQNKQIFKLNSTLRNSSGNHKKIIISEETEEQEKQDDLINRNMSVNEIEIEPGYNSKDKFEVLSQNSGDANNKEDVDKQNNKTEEGKVLESSIQEKQVNEIEERSEDQIEDITNDVVDSKEEDSEKKVESEEEEEGEEDDGSKVSEQFSEQEQENESEHEEEEEDENEDSTVVEEEDEKEDSTVEAEEEEKEDSTVEEEEEQKEDSIVEEEREKTEDPTMEENEESKKQHANNSTQRVRKSEQSQLTTKNSADNKNESYKGIVERQEVQNNTQTESESDDIIERHEKQTEAGNNDQSESESDEIIESDQEQVEIDQSEDSDDNALNNETTGENVNELPKTDNYQSDGSDMDNNQNDTYESDDNKDSFEIETNEQIPNNIRSVNRSLEKEKTLKSPEAILHNRSNHIESSRILARDSNVRKTKSMIRNLNDRPSLAPIRESTGISDGTRDSSVEGSGWDSHRTTRKTLRQTFGKDFTPRKSLRALVMEKSAKRQTDFNRDFSVQPPANSTELPNDTFEENEPMHVDESIEKTNHDVSRRTRQATLETYLQKLINQNKERKKKLEEEVRNKLETNVRGPLSIFKVPLNPVRRAIKPKQNKGAIIPIDAFPTEMLEELKYKPPKRFRPNNASWITKRLYKFLENKLETKYDYKARVRAEKLVQTIYNFTKDVRRHDVAPADTVDVLKQEMARLEIVKTHFEFYDFFDEYMPREIRIKVIPDVVNKISLPRNGIFADILR